MYILCILLILVYINAQMDSHDIEVMNSGLMKIHREDMLIVFFVTIHHHGERARNIMATMVECCEKVTDDDVDCELISVQGENVGVLQPGTTLNVTFIYPNIYGYNRKGSCIVDIWNRGEGNVDDSSEIRHRIDFDTTIRLPSEDIPPFLKPLYLPDKVLRCETTDLDPFDGCNPVDCRLKYSGMRNYYNRKRKRCQKVPVCNGDPSKSLPDVVYVPMTNTCRDLEKENTKEDLSALVAGQAEPMEQDMYSEKVNIQCHHGEIEIRTGICICDKGWTSEPFDPTVYEQGITVYHMCNVKCHPDVPPSFSPVPLIIGLCLALWVTFLVMFCESTNLFCELYSERHENAEIRYYPVGENH